VTDFGVSPESAVTIPESLVTMQERRRTAQEWRYEYCNLRIRFRFFDWKQRARTEDHYA